MATVLRENDVAWPLMMQPAGLSLDELFMRRYNLIADQAQVPSEWDVGSSGRLGREVAHDLPLSSHLIHWSNYVDDDVGSGQTTWHPPLRRENVYHDIIQARIDALRHDAGEEAEPFNEASASSLLTFCDIIAPGVRPAIFRLQTGTLRASWENRDKNQHIGLQFLNEDLVQFVLLRQSAGAMLKTVGIDGALVVRQIIQLLGLSQLWFRG